MDDVIRKRATPFASEATPSSLKGYTIFQKGCSLVKKRSIFLYFKEDKQRNLIIDFVGIYYICN
ncbi:hypothetical protein DWX97_19335 [Bacteroides cellulosilyticus]|uniref:Uncharacterized protein n=1 Tax=Bacteroides cellulosilyticus TaxID=246787 RepID=A0A412ICJ2_9BACE|nr:hypothetical protein DWX97_19335 [Bacteroides cellulosilyticus]